MSQKDHKEETKDREVAMSDEEAFNIGKWVVTTNDLPLITHLGREIDS